MIKKVVGFITGMTSNIWFQIVSILFSLTVLILMGYHFTTYYSAIEKDPEITYAISKEKGIKNSYAATVNVGLHINNFWKFDVNNNDFIVDAVLWFSFNPGNVSMDVIDKFEIENAEIIKQTGPILRMVGDKLFAYYYLRIQFKSLLDYSNFPLDDHRLFIIITNKTISKEFLYATDKESFSKQQFFHYLKDYKLVGYDARFGYQNLPLHFWDQRREVSYPAVVFSLDFKKSGFGDILIVFAPLFLMFFFGIMSLILDIFYEATIVSLSLGSLSALVLYRFILQGVSPAGAGFTTSDKSYFIILALSFLVFISEIGLLGYTKNDAKRKKRANILRKILLLIILITIMVFMYYLLPIKV
jgi:hypothetical protein